MNADPILFTFRRCPYAIRARMALAYANIHVNEHEVDLKNKPQDLINASAKATVPVLILADGLVIDESLDIIRWALNQSDPDGWLRAALKHSANDLIHTNDHEFKPILDGYKYPQQSEKKDPVYYRDKANDYLRQLNSLLMNNRYLLADQISIADIAIFPFIRQFYLVDQPWFAQSERQQLQRWLGYFLNSALFLRVMKK